MYAFDRLEPLDSAAPLTLDLGGKAFHSQEHGALYEAAHSVVGPLSIGHHHSSLRTRQNERLRG